MFLTGDFYEVGGYSYGRNPLKSGQCFLHGIEDFIGIMESGMSQSPQIGSMFLTHKAMITNNTSSNPCRNPLKSGQCFLPGTGWNSLAILALSRNPLKSGQCFLPEL